MRIIILRRKWCSRYSSFVSPKKTKTKYDRYKRTLFFFFNSVIVVGCVIWRWCCVVFFFFVEYSFLSPPVVIHCVCALSITVNSFFFWVSFDVDLYHTVRRCIKFYFGYISTYKREDVNIKTNLVLC